jgi:hypothetical protein
MKGAEMAKKTKRDAVGVEVDASPAASSIQEALLGGLLKANKSYLGGQRPLVGLEGFSLAEQYLYDLPIIPLGVLLHLCGRKKSRKTTYLLRLCSLFCASKQHALAIPCEGKWSPSLETSILGMPLPKTYYLQPAESTDGWITMSADILTRVEKLSATKRAIMLKARPTDEDKKILAREDEAIILGIDAITGAQSEMIQEMVNTVGAGKTFYDRAQQFWQFFGTWGPRIARFPVLLVAVNHLLAPSAGVGHRDVARGGEGAGFHCALQVNMKAIKELPTRADGIERTQLEMSLEHSSLGRSKRKISVNCCVHQPVDGTGPRSWFDWDGALVDILVNEYAARPVALKKHMDDAGLVIKLLGKDSNVATCPAYGLDEKTVKAEKLDASQVGARLSADPAFVAAFRRVFVTPVPEVIVWRNDIRDVI